MKPCLLFSPRFQKAELYPSQVEKRFMKVDWALRLGSLGPGEGHACALGAKTMKGTPIFRFCHFSATPEEMEGMLLYYGVSGPWWGQVSTPYLKPGSGSWQVGRGRRRLRDQDEKSQS